MEKAEKTSVSQTEFARLHNVGKANVTFWARKGLVVFDANKKVVVEDSNELLKKVGYGKFNTKRVQSEDNADVNMATARKELALARKHEIAVEELEGRLVDAAVAREHAYALARMVQDKLTSWPARASHLLANEVGVDVGVMAAALEKAIRNELNEIADEIESARPSDS